MIMRQEINLSRKYKLLRPLKMEEMMLVFISEKEWIPGQARNDSSLLFRVKLGMTVACHSGESRNPFFF